MNKQKYNSHMSIRKCEGLISELKNYVAENESDKKIHDSLTESSDFKDTSDSNWELVKTKSVYDSDGFLTEYSMWYNEDTGAYNFIFGDSDIYTPETADFDWENIEPGDYQVTFKTEGYQYMIDTTDKYEVGEEVGLTFGPQDIHIMKKGSY